jgi:hypothetical protein
MEPNITEVSATFRHQQFPMVRVKITGTPCPEGFMITYPDDALKVLQSAMLDFVRTVEIKGESYQNEGYCNMYCHDAAFDDLDTNQFQPND